MKFSVCKEMGYTRDLVSMQGLGYKELFPYLAGECTLEEAVYIIKRDTRHFAKRQLTWFRREKDVIWLNKPDFDYDEEKILSYMLDRWNEIVSADAKEEGVTIMLTEKAAMYSTLGISKRSFRIWNEN